MYINKYIIMFMLIVLFSSCNQPELASDANGHIQYLQYLDGNVRSFDIINDSLFVASEDYGVVVYKIMQSNGKAYLDSLTATNVVGNPVTLDIAPESRSLIVLDNYNHTYIGKLDNLSSMSAVRCDDYQRKSTFIDYGDKPIELITPFRHKPTQNEVDTLAWDTSFIHRIKFSEDVYDFGIYSGDCSDTLYKYLNYEIEDVFYNNEKLYLINPEDTVYSVVSLNHEVSIDTFSVIDTLVLDNKPLTMKTNENYMFIGLDDNQGCYIKLLDSNNLNHSNFSIALGYDIQDIQVSNDYIALSSGYDGPLIFEWNESGYPELSFLIGGIYAYKTVMYDDLNMIVGTKNGLHIYEIER